MKKIISILTVLLFCLALMLPVTVSAASASASLSGPGTVRAGDTITLSFNLNGSGIFGASGTLSYDSSQVTLSGTSQKIGAPWAVEFNGNNFVAYDNNLTNPINNFYTASLDIYGINSDEFIEAIGRIYGMNLKRKDKSKPSNMSLKILPCMNPLTMIQVTEAIHKYL